ncbi:hypothetical protein R1flu_014949 [Riccia fluitans]|uniref:Thioredoxin domain-containing protein n=1 Tax=Riccia fluitans TaxID=41844 RepID=A0ABD1YHX9_9MARC
MITVEACAKACPLHGTAHTSHGRPPSPYAGTASHGRLWRKAGATGQKRWTLIRQPVVLKSAPIPPAHSGIFQQSKVFAFHHAEESIETRQKDREERKMTTRWAVKNVESKAELDAAVAQGGPAFAHFWASWCEPSKHMDEVFAQLAVDTPYAQFFRVEAEEQPEIADFYGVTTVPFFLFFKDGVEVDRMEGANAPELANKVSKHAGAPLNNTNAAAPASLGMVASPMVLEVAQHAHQPVYPQLNGGHEEEAKDPATGLSESLKAEIASLISSKPVMLFMKGHPDEPRCGFSRKVVDVLKEEGVEFGSFDILSNDAVRQGLKTYSNWPTYPQLYVKGELIGGADIILEMSKSGELRQVLADASLPDDSLVAALNGVLTDNGDSAPLKEAKEDELNQRLKNLINLKPVMLFMKGTPEEPKCGFSRKVVGFLNETGVEFGSFNILADEEVRQGLKTYSNWPTYPQLYVQGELLGGCDIITEMHQSGELKQTFADSGLLEKPSLEDRLRQLINQSENVLFMKGTRDEPRCGFSKKVVNALKETEVDFTTFDILSDEEVRQGLKTFSNWPTYPQLYHKGELLGGCDIIMEMKASGELKSALTE